MKNNRIGSPQTAVSCREESSRPFLELLKLVLASVPVAVLSVLLVLSPSDASFAGNEDLAELGVRLQGLRTADSVVLMIVPYPTYFITGLDEVELRKVSCQYEAKSGATLDGVIDALKSNITEYRIGPKPSTGLFIGIAFKNRGKMLQEFYLNDSGGSFNLRGFSDNRIIASRADLPNQLRMLVKNPGVVLIKNPSSRCPH
jgi:hypothetical protein